MDPDIPRSRPSGRSNYSARGPEDLVALAAICLGFVPDDSLVMLSFPTTGRSGPHARVDLPPMSQLTPPSGRQADLVDTACEVSSQLVDALVGPTLLHRVPQVAFVMYGPASPLTEALTHGLVSRFGAEGVEVVTVLRVEGERWFGVLPGHPEEHYAGVGFDLASHPFVADNVLHGRVVLGSRDEVRLGVTPDAPRVAETSAVIGRGVRSASVSRLDDLIREWESCGRSWTPAEVAEVASALRGGRGRDRAWWGLDRRTATGRVDLWRDVVRRVPDELVAGPAAVLAVTAWLAGDGALAWCAVDRCRAVQPDHPLAELVATVLVEAVSPDVATSLWTTAGEDGAA